MVEIEKPRITCLDSVEDISYGKYVVDHSLKSMQKVTQL